MLLPLLRNHASSCPCPRVAFPGAPFDRPPGSTARRAAEERRWSGAPGATPVRLHRNAAPCWAQRTKVPARSGPDPGTRSGRGVPGPGLSRPWIVDPPSTSGTLHVRVVPVPASDSTTSSPPWPAARSRMLCSPLSRTSGGMPRPSSATITSSVSWSTTTLTSTVEARACLLTLVRASPTTASRSGVTAAGTVVRIGPSSRSLGRSFIVAATRSTRISISVCRSVEPSSAPRAKIAGGCP